MDNTLIEGYTNKAKGFFHIVRVLHGYLEFIRPEREENVPIEFSLLLDNLLRLIYPKNLTFLVAKWEINYSILDMTAKLQKLFQKYPSLSKILNKFDNQIIIISFPLPWKEVALFHSLIYHEIAHLMENRIPFNLESESKDAIDDELIDELVKSVRSSILGTSKIKRYLPEILSESKIKSDIIHFIVTNSSKWITEIFCDLFGVFFLKFGFVFAFAATIGTKRSPYSFSLKHPPDFLRFYFIFEALKKLSLTEKLENEFPEIYKMLAETENEEKWGIFRNKIGFESRRWNICIDCVRNLKDKLVRPELFHDLRMESLEYNDSQHETIKLDILFSRLKNFVPINEVVIDNKPKRCNLPLIINAGWKFYYSDEFKKFSKQVKKRNKENEETFSPFLTLNRLIYKSVELSFVEEHLASIREDFTS